MVYRVYVEKKKELAHEAETLKNDLVNLIGINGLSDLRIINRYDVENIDDKLFDYAKNHEYANPWQTSNYGRAAETLGYNVMYLGFEDGLTKHEMVRTLKRVFKSKLHCIWLINEKFSSNTVVSNENDMFV